MKPYALTDWQARALSEDRLSLLIEPLKSQPSEVLEMPGFLQFGHYRVDRHLLAIDARNTIPLPHAVGDRLDPAILVDGYPDYCATLGGHVCSRKSGQWKPLEPHLSKKGRPRITLSNGSNKKTADIHRLVCEAWHGPPPTSAHQVRHINGNPLDSAAANLCWGTQQENWSDRKAHGNGIEGEKHHAAKLTDAEREHLKWGFEKGLFSQRHVARVLGMSQASIGIACNAGAPAPALQDAPDQEYLRFTLEVVAVTVKRLQDVTEGEARAAGLPKWGAFPWIDNPWCALSEVKQI